MTLDKRFSDIPSSKNSGRNTSKYISRLALTGTAIAAVTLGALALNKNGCSAFESAQSLEQVVTAEPEPSAVVETQKRLEPVLFRHEIAQYAQGSQLENWERVTKPIDDENITFYKNPVRGPCGNHALYKDSNRAQAHAFANRSIAIHLLAMNVKRNADFYSDINNWTLTEDEKYTTNAFSQLNLSYSKQDVKRIVALAKSLEGEENQRFVFEDIVNVYTNTALLDFLSDGQRTNGQRILGTGNYPSHMQASVRNTIRGASGGYSISGSENQGVKVHNHNGLETALRTGAALITAPSQGLNNALGDTPVLNQAGSVVQGVFEGLSHAPYHFLSGLTGLIRNSSDYQHYKDAEELLKGIPTDEEGNLLAYRGNSSKGGFAIDTISGAGRLYLLATLLSSGSGSSGSSPTTPGTPNPPTGGFIPGGPAVY